MGFDCSTAHAIKTSGNNKPNKHSETKNIESINVGWSFRGSSNSVNESFKETGRNFLIRIKRIIMKKLFQA